MENLQLNNPKVDIISNEVVGLILKVNKELSGQILDTKKEFEKGVAFVGFRLACDYFFGAKVDLEKRIMLSGTTLVRCGLENIADLYYIYCSGMKKEKYARAYIGSIEVFRATAFSVSKKDIHEVGGKKLMRQINKWTGASIDDRMKSTGPSLQAIYDLFSYFSHPNPASMIYLSNESLKESQINLLKQANCINMLHAIALLLNHTVIKSVTIEDVNNLAKELGFKLLPPA